MNYTTNYQLNKPERNEQFNIDHWNANSDVIDTQMHTNEVNIATNASNISSIITNLTTNKSSDSSSTYFKLMKLIYPVGSIYWSGNSTNPSTLFGGTWTQIKDKFVWAKGDSDTLGATGGAKTVTLTVNNMPSHNHSFTPSGTISITTNPTFTGSAVTSGANNRGHTHTLNNGNTSSTGTTATAGIRHSGNTGGMSANSTGSIEFTKYTPFLDFYDEQQMQSSGNLSFDASYEKNIERPEYNKNTNNERCIYKLKSNIAHTHTLPVSYIYGKTDGESQNHTHSVTASGIISGGAYSFTGTAGTTGSKGSGTAVNIMPPYVVKYCWERTA